jgi:hypothetical protein
MTEAEGTGEGSPQVDRLASQLLEGDEMPSLPPAWALSDGFFGHLAECANIITRGKDAPAWLQPGLARAVLYATQAHAQARDAPLQADMKATLRKVAKMAADLAKALDDADVLLALHRDDGPDPALEGVAPLDRDQPTQGLGLRLIEVANRAREAAGAAGSRGRGRPVRPELGQIAPQAVCGAVIRAAWAKVHGRAPGRNNSGAREAAEALWSASGLRHSTAWGAVTEGGGWDRWIVPSVRQ